MSTAADVVVISRRFRGPPDSANGGYACGLLAGHLHGSAQVRLNHPPPLDEPLTLQTSGERLTLTRDQQIIAEAALAEPTGAVPEPVTFEAATHAAAHYAWYSGHPFAGCFVCGPERPVGDGLRIFAGPVKGRTIVAAPWRPHSSVCDASGLAQPGIVWAALDCPSWFGLLEFEPGTRGALLGQLTARILRRPAANEPCVVIGWSRGRNGRKLYAGAALYSDAGILLGHSESVWIELKSAAP